MLNEVCIRTPQPANTAGPLTPVAATEPQCDVHLDKRLKRKPCFAATSHSAMDPWLPQRLAVGRGVGNSEDHLMMC